MQWRNLDLPFLLSFPATLVTCFHHGNQCRIRSSFDLLYLNMRVSVEVVRKVGSGYLTNVERNWKRRKDSKKERKRKCSSSVEGVWRSKSNFSGRTDSGNTCQHSEWDTGSISDLSWFDFRKVPEIYSFLSWERFNHLRVTLNCQRGAFFVDRVVGAYSFTRFCLVSSLMNGTVHSLTICLFRRVHKITKIDCYIVMSVFFFLSARPHGITRLPLDGFSWNLIFF